MPDTESNGGQLAAWADWANRIPGVLPQAKPDLAPSALNE